MLKKLWKIFDKRLSFLICEEHLPINKKKKDNTINQLGREDV